MWPPLTLQTLPIHFQAVNAMIKEYLSAAIVTPFTSLINPFPLSQRSHQDSFLRLPGDMRNSHGHLIQ